MSDSGLHLLTVTALLGSGLMAGVFFAFSTFVMQGLARLAPNQGIAAMQSINVTAVTMPFMSLFFGTAVVSLIVMLQAWFTATLGGSVWHTIGGLSYLVGSFVVTIACNVPRNNRLAAVHPDSADGARVWVDYLRSWTAWNHVRTVACLASTAAFLIAL